MGPSNEQILFIFQSGGCIESDRFTGQEISRSESVQPNLEDRQKLRSVKFSHLTSQKVSSEF
jgi:hypothetical protein